MIFCFPPPEWKARIRSIFWPSSATIKVHRVAVWRGLIVFYESGEGGGMRATQGKSGPFCGLGDNASDAKRNAARVIVNQSRRKCSRSRRG
jgi:hypothetical protein